MTNPPWPDSFDAILRKHLPLLGQLPIEASTGLPEMGLDSLGTVSLLVELERAFDVMVPDEQLTADTFATGGRLWTMIDGLA